MMNAVSDTPSLYRAESIESLSQSVGTSRGSGRFGRGAAGAGVRGGSESALRQDATPCGLSTGADVVN